MSECDRNDLDRRRRCAVSGEPLFSTEKLGEMLDAAHNPSDTQIGRRPTQREVSDLDTAFDALFLRLSVEEQVKYLCSVPVRDAAIKLDQMVPEDRSDILVRGGGGEGATGRRT